MMISFFMSIALFASYFTTNCTRPELLITSAIFWLAYITYVKTVNIINNIEKDKVDNEEEKR